MANPPESRPPSPPATLPNVPAIEPHRIHLDTQLASLKSRLVREAHTAVGMLEGAIDALFRLDEAAARQVMATDDEVDREEVHIEEDAFRILALFQPYARDFRTLTALLRMNSDLERVADHATSLAKQSIKLFKLGVKTMPVSLLEMGQRVPIQCHALLNSLTSEDVELARSVITSDIAIDSLDKRLFDECLDTMSITRESKAAGLILYRCGRELERVGDLMGNIAEDVIYIAGGAIVRHAEKKRLKREAKQRRET